MTVGTTVLNPGTGGDKVLNDSLSTVDGSAAPASSVAQEVKVGFGAQGDFNNVTTGNPMPVAPSATNFVFSANGVNSSTSQLAAGATFNGTIETTASQQTISILLTMDQPGLLTINQYIDAAGTYLVSSWPFAITANNPFSQAFTANGNYYRVTLKNVGTGITTTLNLNSAVGTLPPVTQDGNNPVTVNSLDGNLDPFGRDPIGLLTAPAGIETTGQRQASMSFPVVLAKEHTDAQTFTFQRAGVIPINTDLMVIDCLKFQGLSVQGVSVGTTGALTFAWSNNGTDWVNGNIFDSGGGTLTTASTAFLGSASVYARYFRIRLTTATTAGNTSINVVGFPRGVQGTQVSNATAANFQATVAQATAANLNATVASITSAVTTLGQVSTGSIASNFAGVPAPSFQGSWSTQSDLASAARTASGNSGGISDSLGGAYSASIVVSAVSGTSPTLDIILQESPDGGTTWTDVYHCERLTAAGTLIVPNINAVGQRRWAWNIGGTTPSFTFSIAPTRGNSTSYPLVRQFIDRTAGLLSGTLNATSSAYQMAGCKTITAAITIGAATTGGTYKLQGSHNNGQSWFDISGTVVAVASSTVQVTSTAGVVARHVRVICSSAATGQTGTEVSIFGTN
jgi:hypothetical protein